MLFVDSRNFFFFFFFFFCLLLLLLHVASSQQQQQQQQSGFSTVEFYKRCREIMEDENSMLISERFFVETILATSEYENFYLLMRAEMQSIQRARSIEASGHK
jgi:hypothetical protein